MNGARLRIASLAIGLLFAGPALAQTYNLTVYSKIQKDANTTAVGQVVLDAGSAATTPAVACATNSTANCVVSAASGASVVLNAVNVDNATFVSWSGCTTAAGTQCTVAMSAAKYVTAKFKATNVTLSAKTYGAGLGYLTAATTPAIDCATGDAGHAACAGAIGYLATNVVVTAVPAAGAKVTSWTGCSTSTATTCTIATVTGSKLVTATFGATNVPVTVAVNGSGSITASGDVTDAIACPGDCAGQVSPGGTITLTASPAAGYNFIGWTGACSGTADCVLANVTAAKSVAATFRTSSCSSCHGTPPSTHVNAAICGDCHVGYSNSSVNAATHMNNVADFSCQECHATPPTSHGPNVGACASCHGAGYSTTSFNWATHRNGVVDVVNAVQPTVVAGDGFNAQILSATLAADARPVVRMKFTNDAGQGLDMAAFWSQYQNRAGWTSSGTARAPALGIARVDADGSFHPAMATTVSSTNSAYAAGASTTENLTAAAFVAVDASQGIYDVTPAVNYMPSTALATPTNLTPRIAFDPNATYRIVFIGARYGGANKQVMFSANATLDVSPTGALVSHNIVTDDACGACHAKFKIGFHSDMRIGSQTCKLCHFDGRGVSGQTVFDPTLTSSQDMGYQNFVHRLHNGLDTKNHWNLTLKGGPIEIKMAPSHKLYFEGASSTGSGNPLVAVVDPELTTECGICHKGTDANVWNTKPSRMACGSCHDINWATGAKWNGGEVVHAAQTDDSGCAVCHPADGVIGGGIYPVKRVHGQFFEPAHNADFTAQVPSLLNGPRNFQVALTNFTADATGKPTFSVTASLDGVPYDLKAGVAASTTTGGRVATCAFQIAGPTTDYVIPATGGTAQSCTSATPWTVVSPGVLTFSTGTFMAGKPVGYYTVSFEIMYTDQMAASNGDVVRHPASANPNFLTVYWNGTTASVVTDPGELALNQRRAVVSFSKCNSCHEDIGFHSNRGRKGPDYCATCHNPKLDNGTRARFTEAQAWTDPAVSATQKVYLPESVSLNVFIHRVHMGEKLPSVSGLELTPVGASTVAASSSPWVPVPGTIAYGATRSAFVGLDAATPPDISDFSAFNMPNPMGRCDQCHISSGAQQTWALNEGTGLAPIERTYRVCDPATPAWATEPWCNVASTSGPAKLTTVSTPPLKAVCTSCHDSAATNAHTDLYTVNPMTAGATELCAACHGAGKAFDSLNVHQPIP